MKWFKFYGQDFFTDPKILSFSTNQKVFWLGLLTLAAAADDETAPRDDRHKGVFDFVTESRVIQLVGIDLGDPELEKLLRFYDELQRLGMIEIFTDETGAQKIRLKNYNKRQSTNLSDAERARDYRHNKSRDDRHAREDKRRVDKIRIDTNTTDAEASGVASGAIIDLFKDLNPSYKNLFKRKNQHEASKRMLDIHGLDRIQKVIGFVAARRQDRFCPTIATPVQLEEKWGLLEQYGAKLRGGTGKGKEIIGLTD